MGCLLMYGLLMYGCITSGERGLAAGLVSGFWLAGRCARQHGWLHCWGHPASWTPVSSDAVSFLHHCGKQQRLLEATVGLLVAVFLMQCLIRGNAFSFSVVVPR